jgi:hypothetical protein
MIIWCSIDYSYPLVDDLSTLGTKAVPILLNKFGPRLPSAKNANALVMQLEAELQSTKQSLKRYLSYFNCPGCGVIRKLVGLP